MALKELHWIPIIILYFAIFFLCIYIIESYKILDWGLYIWGVVYGVLAMAFTAYIILPLLSSILARWSKQGYWHWNEGLLWILWPIMLYIGIATLLWLNIFFDSSPPMIYEAKVLKKWYAPSCIDYLSASDTTGVRERPYIQVVSWRQSEASIYLEVHKSVYDAIGENWTLAVTTQQGFLGWEWIVSVEPIKKS